jgi:hypothetical protein
VATVHLTFGRVGARSNFGDVIVYNGVNPISETVTSSATSTQSTNVVREHDIVQIYCSTAVYVTFGADPTVTPTAGIYCPPCFAVYVGANTGDKIAVIDA